MIISLLTAEGFSNCKLRTKSNIDQLVYIPIAEHIFRKSSNFIYLMSIFKQVTQAQVHYINIEIPINPLRVG